MSSLEVQQHNQTVHDNLELGDLLEFDRGAYLHFGVGVGNGEIVHRTGVNGPMMSGPEHISTLSGKVYDKGVVRKDKFWDVVGNSKARKNNSMDKIFLPFKPAEIVERATSQIGEVGYNVLSKNCEHFATGCRYGTAVSNQADLLTGSVIATGITVARIAVELWWQRSGGKK